MHVLGTKSHDSGYPYKYCVPTGKSLGQYIYWKDGLELAITQPVPLLPAPPSIHIGAIGVAFLQS